jgi:hypothetical protein
VLAGGEAVIEALLVVDREGRRLLLIEGRQTFPFAPGALQRHAARDDGRNRQPRPDLIEERIGEFHWKQWACAARLGPQASAVHHLNSLLEQIGNEDLHVQRRAVENDNGWAELPRSTHQSISKFAHRRVLPGHDDSGR